MRKPLAARSTRRYVLTPLEQPSASQPASRAECIDDGRRLVMKAGGKTVLHYNHALVESPAGIDPVYRRSGHIHPLFNPAGQPLTGDFPADHPHQHAIFNAWVNTTFKDHKLDFWNQAAKNAAISHRRVTGPLISGPVFAQFDALLHHEDLTDPEHPAAILKEHWVVRVYNLSDFFLVDLVSLQTCIADAPLTINEYHYGGMAIRGHVAWLLENRSEAEQVDHDTLGFLTSEGKTRKDGNHSAARWVEMHGPLDGVPTGVTVMSHRRNFRAPVPVRLHPSKPYFCFAPMVKGEFEMKPNETQTARYRFYSHMGKPVAAISDRLWDDFSRPPRATISEK